MLATLAKSEMAAQISIHIIDAFIRMKHAHYFLARFTLGRKLSSVITLLPVLSSNAFRAFLAMVPPFFPASAFSSNPLAKADSAIWREDSSAKAVKSNSASHSCGHANFATLIPSTPCVF